MAWQRNSWRSHFRRVLQVDCSSIYVRGHNPASVQAGSCRVDGQDRSKSLSDLPREHANSDCYSARQPAIVLTHSQAGAHGWILGDARPDLVKAIIALEPLGPPFSDAIFSPVTPDFPYGLTSVPLTFSPPITSSSDLHPVAIYSDPANNFTCFQQGSKPPRQLANLARIPVLLVTSHSSYHQIYDNCSVQFLQQAGVHVKHVRLQDVGIFGNGHMMFMEKNNIQIAEEVLEKWIDETLR